MRKLRKGNAWLRMPSPAMTVACVALAVALSGASYAAVLLPRNSVGTPQLKANAVTSPKVKDNALTGADIDEARLGKVPNANRLDSLDSSAFLPAGAVRFITSDYRFGPLPKTSAAFTTTTGSLVIGFSGTGYRASPGNGCFYVGLFKNGTSLDPGPIAGTCLYFNQANVHATLPTGVLRAKIAPGTYQVNIATSILATDPFDEFHMWVYEMP
jgi:hypothetical protein